MRLVLFQVRSLFSFRPNSPVSRSSQPSSSTCIQLNSMKMLRSVSQSSSRRFKHSEIVVNFLYMSQTCHQLKGNRLIFIQCRSNSPSLTAIQFDVPQIASTCQYMSRNCLKSSVGVSNSQQVDTSIPLMSITLFNSTQLVITGSNCLPTLLMFPQFPQFVRKYI